MELRGVVSKLGNPSSFPLISSFSGNEFSDRSRSQDKLAGPPVISWIRSERDLHCVCDANDSRNFHETEKFEECGSCTTVVDVNEDCGENIADSTRASLIPALVNVVDTVRPLGLKGSFPWESRHVTDDRVLDFPKSASRETRSIDHHNSVNKTNSQATWSLFFPHDFASAALRTEYQSGDDSGIDLVLWALNRTDFRVVYTLSETGIFFIVISIKIKHS